MPEQTWWYISRASGIVTLVAAGAAVIWGLALSTRVIRRRSLPKWLLDLHRFLGAITVAFLALHLVALVADNFVHFGVADLAVPFYSPWKTTAVAWGVLAAYLLVAVQVTSLAKRRMSLKVWRWFHFASFPAYVLSLVHAVTAGTDASNRVFVVLAFLMTAVIVFLTIVRAIAARTEGTKGRRPGPSRAPVASAPAP